MSFVKLVSRAGLVAEIPQSDFDALPLSLAGAAFVAWRWRHPQVDPMSRAVRAAARARLV